MGLGSADVVTLAEARDKALDARRTLASGRNPIEARRAAMAAVAAKPTFGDVADALIAAKESEWRNDKHRAQWRMTLETYAAPLRSRPVDEIDTEAVLAVLKPIWQEKPETASRLRGRIEAVLDAAKAQGLRSGENPAAWRGHLSHLLPKRGVLTRGHHAAMDYRDVPAFLGATARARGHGGAGAGILHPDGDALGRDARRALVGNRHGGEGLDRAGGAHEGGARASRYPCPIARWKFSKSFSKRDPATSCFRASVRTSRCRIWRWKWCCAG